MLESALLNRSDSVCIDILTYEDLAQLRTRSRKRHDNVFSSTTASKRYLILTYAAEFDRVCYPLPLSPEVEPDTAAMQRTILRLRHEIEILRLGSKQQHQHSRHSTSYDVLKVEYNELQAAHEALVHESESRIQSLRDENERLRDELLAFQCEEPGNKGNDTNVVLKRRLKATERTLEQERLAHQRAREISEQVEADLRRQLRGRRTRSVSTNRRLNYARPIGRIKKRKKIAKEKTNNKKQVKKKKGRRVRSASPALFKRFDPTAYNEKRKMRLKAVNERRQRQIKRAMSPVPRRTRGRSLTVRTTPKDVDDDNISRGRSVGSRRSGRRSTSVESKKKKKKKKVVTRRSTSRKSRLSDVRNRRSSSRKKKISKKENRGPSPAAAAAVQRPRRGRKVTKKKSVADHWMNLNGPSIRVTPQRLEKKKQEKIDLVDESVAMKSFRTDTADINEIDERLNKLQHFLRAAKKGQSISDLPRV